MQQKRVLLVTLAPPENNHGVRIVLYRHLIQNRPFELHVVCSIPFKHAGVSSTHLKLPTPIHRLRNSRYGPILSKWVLDFENLLWHRCPPNPLASIIRDFQPDCILTLADNSISRLAHAAAKSLKIPLAVMFLDWFPIMRPHIGHSWTQSWLDAWFPTLYRECDLAICTSDGMFHKLGPHANCRIIYPIPGTPAISQSPDLRDNKRFRIVYVGSVEHFYGRMLCSLVSHLTGHQEIELIVIGPNADWPPELLRRCRSEGIYLGFKTPEEATNIIAQSDALLVVMSFESEHRLFMQTSFTTKLLDYVAYSKPIILWSPTYTTPFQIIKQHGGALLVDDASPLAVITACKKIMRDPSLREQLVSSAKALQNGLFNSTRLQKEFATSIASICH